VKAQGLHSPAVSRERDADVSIGQDSPPIWVGNAVRTPRPKVSTPHQKPTTLICICDKVYAARNHISMPGCG
jgi:hypothetical protein